MPHLDEEEIAVIHLMARKAIREQIAVERELGSRSFKHFFKMAWGNMDPAPFVGNWHLDLVCETLQQVAMRQVGDTVICIPPRSAKSLMTSVAFPAWIWTWWPSCKFITASYDQRLASRDALKCRRLIESPWYRARWGDKVALVKDQNQKLYYQTTAGGHRWTASPKMGVTGEGADFVLFDDPHSTTKAESPAERLQVELFWFEGIPSRMNNPQAGRKLVIQQRVNERDLAGQCIERGYNKVVLPAMFEYDHPQVHPRDPRTIDGEPLWPARFRKIDYEKLMQELGPYAAQGQYQQRPVAREGGLFNRDWFTIIDAEPMDVQWVRRWDFASTEVTMGSDPDYTAGVLLGKSPSTKKFYIKDVQRLRKSFSEVESRIKSTASIDGKKVRIGLPIDPGNGKALYEYMVGQLTGYSVEGERETAQLGSKIARAQPLASQAEVGNVLLVKGDWNRAFLDEVSMFPMGAHDDQVDAASGAFRMLLSQVGALVNFYAAQKRDIDNAPKQTELSGAFTETNPWHKLK